MLWYFDSWSFPGSSNYREVTWNGCGYVFSYNEESPAAQAGWKHDWYRLGNSYGSSELLHGKVKGECSVVTRSYGTKKVIHQGGWFSGFTPDDAIRLGREDWVFAGWYNGTFHYHEARLTSRGWMSDVFCGMEVTPTGPPESYYISGRGWYYNFPCHVVYRWGSPYYPSSSKVGDIVPPPWSPVTDPRGTLYDTVDTSWEMSPYHRIDSYDIKSSNIEYPHDMDEFGLFVMESGIWPSYGFYPNLASQAYQSAVSNLPQADCNTMANILDVISVIKSLLRGYIKPDSIADLASSAWLSYRYAYSTTVGDIEEYSKLASRLVALVENDTITTRGTCSRGGVTCNCTVAFRITDVLPRDTVHKLQTWGLKCSAVNLWDMVPYSFVVDWFFHISDILESMELYGKSLQCKPISVWTTFKSSQSNSDGVEQECFLRLSGRPPLHVHYDFASTSSKTLLRRILDTGALLIGGSK